MRNRIQWKRADVFLMFGCIILALLLLLPNLLQRGNRQAVIWVDGQEYARIALHGAAAPYVLRPETKPELEITVFGDAIAFTAASCPDKRCVRYGTLRSVGQSAACLPAKTVICIRGGTNRGPDAITY